jgi:uncharacterized RDD family membrane protein YckC
MSEDAPVSGHPPRAEFGARLVALVLDFFVVLIVERLLVAVLGGVGFFVSVFGGLAYFTYFEGTTSGQTVGKRAMSIRVIDATTGGPLGPARALIRYIGRFASALVLGLGYFWALWDPDRQTWHDKIAGTYVVPTSDYPVAEWPGSMPS